MKTHLLALCAFSLGSVALAAESNTLTAADKAAGWQSLFDGQSLDGWKASEKPGTFSVKDGELVVKGPRSHLFYEGAVQNHNFKDFELKLDVKTYPKANSGVYFHTAWQETSWPSQGYEIQVNNSHTDPKRTAGIYAIKDNLDKVASDEVWFTLKIKVEGKHIQTFVDDKLIEDYTEEEHPVRPTGMEHRLISSGTFALQGHDPGSEIHYRNIRVRALP